MFSEYILWTSMLLEFFQQTCVTFKIGKHERISILNLKKKDPRLWWVVVMVVVEAGVEIWLLLLSHTVMSRGLKEKIGTF